MESKHYSYFCKKCGLTYSGNKYQAMVVRRHHRAFPCRYGRSVVLRRGKPTVIKVREQIADLCPPPYGGFITI